MMELLRWLCWRFFHLPLALKLSRATWAYGTSGDNAMEASDFLLSGGTASLGDVASCIVALVGLAFYVRWVK